MLHSACHTNISKIYIIINNRGTSALIGQKPIAYRSGNLTEN